MEIFIVVAKCEMKEISTVQKTRQIGAKVAR